MATITTELARPVPFHCSPVVLPVIWASLSAIHRSGLGAGGRLGRAAAAAAGVCDLAGSVTSRLSAFEAELVANGAVEPFVAAKVRHQELTDMTRRWRLDSNWGRSRESEEGESEQIGSQRAEGEEEGRGIGRVLWEGGRRRRGTRARGLVLRMMTSPSLTPLAAAGGSLEASHLSVPRFFSEGRGGATSARASGRKQLPSLSFAALREGEGYSEGCSGGDHGAGGGRKAGRHWPPPDVR